MNDAPKTDHAYQFAGWDLQVDARQVLTQQGEAVLEPRAFDLLLYLVENRHRIVSKDELLTKVWKTNYLSESVLARAVMKTRKALIDGGVEGDWIRTAHRVGYQFVGEPLRASPRTEQSPEASSASMHRVALLPFENETGDLKLAWVELGLLTMVVRAMSATQGLAVEGIDMVVGALAAVPAKAGIDARIAQLRSALGTSTVIRTVITQMDQERYRLAWSVWLASDVQRRGELVGTQLTALALELAKELAEEIGVVSKQARARIDLSSDEDFAMAAHARAIQAFAKEQYEAARALMAACMRLGPHSLQADVDNVAATAAVDANEAVRLGEALVGRVDWLKHPVESMTLLRALADATLRLQELDSCEKYCDEAEDHLDPQADYGNYRWFAYFRISMAQHRGHMNSARHTGRAWVERARERGDSLDLAHALGNLGKVEALGGEWSTGKALIDEANVLARQYQLWASLGANLSNLAVSHSWRGRIRESHALMEESAELVRASGQGDRLLPILVNLYTSAWDLGDGAGALRYMAQVEERLAGANQWMLSYRAHLVDARMRFGELTEACALAQEAAHQIKEIPGVHMAMGSYLTAMVAAGALDEVSAIVDAISESYEAPNPSMAHANFLLAVAQLAYARGDARSAYGIVERYVANRGGLACSYKGCTDLMWLAMDLGSVHEALEMSAEVSDHLNQTLRGHSVSARMHFETGEYGKAVERQRMVVGMATGRRLLPYLTELLKRYESAERGEQRDAICVHLCFLRPSDGCGRWDEFGTDWRACVARTDGERLASQVLSCGGTDGRPGHVNAPLRLLARPFDYAWANGVVCLLPQFTGGRYGGICGNDSRQGD